MRIRRLITFFCLSWLLLAAPALAERLTLFHTGNMGGLASGYRYEVRYPYVLSAEFVRARGPELGIRDMSVSQTSIYFHAGRQFLWGPGFGVRELHQFLQDPPMSVETRSVQVLQAHDSLNLEISPDQNLMQELNAFLQRRPDLRQHLQSQQAQLVTYPGPVYQLLLPDSGQMQRNPLHWELIIGFSMQVRGENVPAQELLMLGKPQGEGSRRLALMQRLRSPRDLLVDSGNLLEGLSSVRTNQLSLQRQHSLKMAQDLNYFALNVGKNELRGGLNNLQQEAEKYNLPYLSASILRQGEYVFPPYKVFRLGQKQVALIALADTYALKQLQYVGELEADLEILSAEAALEKAIQQLQSQARPDMLVVLSNAPRDELQQLADTAQDLHLILGDTAAPLQHVRESVERYQLDSPRPFVPSANAHAINLVELNLRGENLEMRNEQVPIRFDLPPSMRFLPDILAVRQEAYADALDTLIPNLEQAIRQDPELLALFLKSRTARETARKLGGYRPLSDAELLEYYPPFITAEMLLNLEMNALMELFEAEVVVFKRSDSFELNIPGAVPKLLVYESLRMNDTLARYYLNGDQLKALLNLPDSQLLFGGVKRGAAPLVWGRPLGDKRTVYKVLIPSGVSGLPAVRPLLEGTRQQEKLTLPFQSESAPQSVYLRNVLVRYLERLSIQPDAATEMLRLVRPLWHDKQSLLSLRIDNLQLNLSGYNAMNNDAYGEVRDTRVTSANSFTFGGRTKLGLNWDNRWLGFNNQLNALFEGLSLLDESDATGPQERLTINQDDLVFSSELQLRLFEFAPFETPLTLTPYLEGIYDTEFMPTVNTNTNSPNPLQSELRGVLGLSIPASAQLKTFKTGLALRRDLNIPDNLEGGFDLKLVHEQPFGSSLSWNNDLDLRYFFPSPNDNASSLGLIAQWVSSVKFSLTHNLSLRFYADSYLFHGKLPETSQLGVSVILGVGLGFDRVWKPYYENLL
ncbi:MAG: hypothetical protein IGS03_08950 [Candidatus Sericytochromatia bacterium]|nr:hypothetical protein [Candidatus Sericytochromatia bacterium]